MNKKIIIRVVIGVVIAGLLATGLYFLLRRQYTIKQPFEGEITMLSAYEQADKLVQKIQPESLLKTYSVVFIGKEAIEKRQVDGYAFIFQGSYFQTRLRNQMFIVYVDIEEKTLQLTHLKDVGGNELTKTWAYPVEEIDAGRVFDALEVQYDGVLIEEIVTAHPETEIGILSEQYTTDHPEYKGTWWVIISRSDGSEEIVQDYHGVSTLDDSE